MRLSSFLAVIFSQNLIGVTSEDYLGTPLGDDRNIFNKDGNRVREVHKNLIGPRPGNNRIHLLGVRVVIISEKPFGKLNGFIDAYAAMGKVSSRPRKQLLQRSIVQVNGIGVGKLEFHAAERVFGPGA